jgi:hypothetical protein
MPTQSVTIDSGILTQVGIMAAKERRDGLALTSGVLAGLKKALTNPASRRWREGGRFNSAFSVADHSSFTDLSASGGYAPLSAGSYEPNRALLYKLADSGGPVYLSSNEIRNFTAGSSDVDAEWQRRVESMVSQAYRKFTQQVVSGNVAGFDTGGNSGWSTMNGIDRAWGFMEDDAVGSQTNDFGGLDRGIYQTIVGAQNQVQNAADLFGSNGLNGLFSLITSSKRHKDIGTKIFLASDAGCNNLKRSTQAYERYVSQKELDPGLVVTMFQGIPIFQEPQMPVSTATGGIATNSNPLTFLLWDMDDIFPAWAEKIVVDDDVIPDGFFGVSDVAKRVSGNQLVWTQYVACAGQLVACDVGSSGILHSGETF